MAKPCTKLNAHDQLRMKTKLNQIGVLQLFNKRWDLPHTHLLKELLVEDKSWCKKFTYRGHLEKWTDEAWAKAFSFKDLSGSDAISYRFKPQNHRISDEEVRKHVSLKGNKVYSGWKPESIEDPDFRFFVMAYQFLFSYHTRRNLVNSHLLMFLDYAWKGNIVNWADLVQKHVSKEVKLYIKSKGERKNELNVAPFLYYLYEHFGEITPEEREQVPLPLPLNKFQSEKGKNRTEDRMLEVEKEPVSIKAELIEVFPEEKGRKRKESEELDAAASLLLFPLQNHESIKRSRAGEDLISVDKRVNESDAGRAGRPPRKGALLKLMADLVREARTKRQELKVAGNSNHPHAEAPATGDISKVPPLVPMDTVASKASYPKLRPVCGGGLARGGPHDKAPSRTCTAVKESVQSVQIQNKDEQIADLTLDELYSVLLPTDEVVKLVSTSLNARIAPEVKDSDVQHFRRAPRGLVSEDARVDGNYYQEGFVVTCNPVAMQEYVASDKSSGTRTEEPLGSSSPFVRGNSSRPSRYVDKALQCDIVSDVCYKCMDGEPNRIVFKPRQGSSSASCEANCELLEQVDVVEDSDHKLSSRAVFLEPQGDKHLGHIQIARKDGSNGHNAIGAASDFKSPPAQKQVLSPNCAENITKGQANKDSQEIQAPEGRNLSSTRSEWKDMSLCRFLEKFEVFWFEEIRPLMTFLESKLSRDVIHSSGPGKYVKLVTDCFVKMKLKENECQQLLEVLEKHLRSERRNTSATSASNFHLIT